MVALGIERGSVVRLVAFERGQTMDEYLSVPEFYGALPPRRRDGAAGESNPPRKAHRREGCGDSRQPAKSASSPAELPPPDEVGAELAEALGIPGTGIGFDEAKNQPGAVTVTHG